MCVCDGWGEGVFRQTPGCVEHRMPCTARCARGDKLQMPSFISEGCDTILSRLFRRLPHPFALVRILLGTRNKAASPFRSLGRLSGDGTQVFEVFRVGVSVSVYRTCSFLLLL